MIRLLTITIVTSLYMLIGVKVIYLCESSYYQDQNLLKEEWYLLGVI